jgi:hypothetical protein
MSATLRVIVDEALSAVGEVSGAGSQAYSEDRMRRDAVKAFNMLFKKYHWPQYMKWFRGQLDGATGKFTTALLENVRDFEDIGLVCRDGETSAISYLPKNFNPYAITSNQLRYYSALPSTDADYETKFLQFWPNTSVEWINVQARVYPKTVASPTWGWNDKLYLDKDMLVDAVAYITLSGDDLNAGAADMHRNMMETRYADIIANMGARKIAIGGVQSPIPDKWFVS